MGRELMELDAARELLGAMVRPLAPGRIPLEEALGLRLAAPAEAALDLPPAAVSAMDGYAVRSRDLGTGEGLPVVMEIPAGVVPPPLEEGAAARIFTGAPLPPGADTVVPQELATPDGEGRVRLEVLPRGAHVRDLGEVVGAGSTLATPGDEVTPQLLGLLAGAGVEEVEAVPRPVLAVVGTGSELVGQGLRPGPGQIRDSNGPMLTALARAQGLEPPTCSRVADRLPDLVSALGRAMETAHVVLTTGGVSVGDYDLVPAAVEELGGEVLVHGVAQKPGKPILVARLRSGWLVGLPGNPVAVLVGWRLFALPLVAALGGWPGAFAERPLDAVLTEAQVNPGRRTVLMPAVLEKSSGGWSVTPLPWKGSHDLAASGRANALLRLQPGAAYAAGEPAPCYPLSFPCGNPSRGLTSPEPG